jgi:hypothetical protein
MIVPIRDASPHDLPRHAAPAAGRIAGAQPGRALAALHDLDARLEGGAAPDRHPPRVARRGHRRPADDLHEGEERDEPAVAAGRDASSSSCRTATPRRTRRPEPAVPDADPTAGRRAASPTPRRACRTSPSAGRPVAGLPQRPSRRGAALPLASRPSTGAEARAAHEAPRRDRHVAVGSRQPPHLLRGPDDLGRRREGAPREAVHGQHPNAETPLESLWAVDLDPLRTTRLTSRPELHRGRPSPVSPDSRWVGFTGISSERYKRNITEQNINGDLYLLEAATGPPSSASRQRRGRREHAELLPRQPLGGLQRPGRPERYTMTNRRVYLRATATAAGPGASSARLRRQRHDRVLVGGRRTRSTSTRASARPASCWRWTSRRTRCAS